MTGLILGLILGAAIGGCMLLLLIPIDGLYTTVYPCDDDAIRAKKLKKKRLYYVLKSLTISLSIAIFIVSAPIGINIERQESIKWCASYTAYKSTLETSMDSEYMSGLERIELASKAAQTNADLAARKYSCQQWYGFGYDKMILDLEPIELR